MNIRNYKIQFNFLKIVIPIFLLFSIMSCMVPIDKMDDLPINPDPKIRYLALGDSYTIGQGVIESKRWPNQLIGELEGDNYNVEFSRIIAQTGWTTNDLIQAIENTEIEDYNLVSLLIGVNNQYQNKSFEIFEAEFDILLNKSIEFAKDSSRVFVVSIPDYGVTPFGSSNSAEIGQELDIYNEYMSTRCTEKNIPFINITEISRELGDSEGSLASDNLHPSGSQYTEWVNEILPTIVELLEK